jgi:hypothetical protein
MLTPKRTFIFSIVVVTALLLVSSADGQKSTDVLPAPFPVQITRGKTVFISNAGGDTNYLYSGGPDRLDHQFYAAIQSWGRYQLVAGPGDAELVLAISFSNQFVGDKDPRGNGSSSPLVGRLRADPQFRLTVLDPGTRVTIMDLHRTCAIRGVGGQSRQKLRSSPRRRSERREKCSRPARRHIRRRQKMTMQELRLRIGWKVQAQPYL